MYSTSRENKTTSDPNLQQLSEAILPKQVTGISALKMGHDSVFREKKYASAEKNKFISLFDIFGAS